MKLHLGVTVAMLGPDRAGMSCQATMLMALATVGAVQMFYAGLNLIGRRLQLGSEGRYRTGFETWFVHT